MIKLFRKNTKVRSQSYTGVKAVLSAAHRDQTTGKVHGHTWEVIAWFRYTGTDVAILKYRLDAVVKPLDHTCLADKIAWGEALAAHIGNEIYAESCRASRGDCEVKQDCIAVEVNRPLEGIYARWEL